MTGSIRALERRLREELAKLRVEINEDKSRMVDLVKGGSFSFLGLEYRRIRSFNSAVLLKDFEIGQAFHKTLLPTYDVFDEDRYFEPAQEPGILELGGWRPVPNARDVTFSTGAACLRLNSAIRTRGVSTYPAYAFSRRIDGGELPVRW